MTDAILPSPLRVGSVQFEAGAKVADVQAEIDSVLAVNRDEGADDAAAHARVLTLTARLATLTDVVRQCEILFLEYADNYLAKDPPDRAKAVRNTEMAMLCRRAFAAGAPLVAHAEVKRLREALWAAWHELNTIRARDGIPWTGVPFPMKTDVDEEYFSKVVDDAAAALGDFAKPWPPSAPPTPDDAGLKMLVDQDWLRRKTETDPDDAEVEARSPDDAGWKDRAEVREAVRFLRDQAYERVDTNDHRRAVSRASRKVYAALALSPTEPEASDPA